VISRCDVAKRFNKGPVPHSSFRGIGMRGNLTVVYLQAPDRCVTFVPSTDAQPRSARFFWSDSVEFALHNFVTVSTQDSLHDFDA